MKLLISNDDGVHARGLESLVEHLKEIAELDVIAPDRNHSGSSSALTLDRPLYPQCTVMALFLSTAPPPTAFILA